MERIVFYCLFENSMFAINYKLYNTTVIAGFLLDNKLFYRHDRQKAIDSNKII